MPRARTYPWIPTLLAAALAACGGGSDSGSAGAEPRADDALLQVSAANNAFGFDLLRRVHDGAEEPNVLLSPLSASLALAMTANGAAGETLDAMREVLRLRDLTEESSNIAYRSLLEDLPGRDEQIEFRLANSIWARDDLPFEEPFLDLARREFDAEVATLDFADPDSPRTINRWAEEHTGGRIDEIIERIDPLDIMYLVNAVYFSAPWSHPFEEEGTSPQAFRTLDGRSVEVPTMRLTHTLPVWRDEALSVVELPYGEGDFAMTLLLPAENRDLDTLIESLDAERWQQYVDALEPTRILLRLPSFRFESESLLRPVLAHLGMQIAFDPERADFARLTRARDDVHISDVRQKAYIDVHELGTEAAAATTVTAGIVSMPPAIEFDRPFVFAIRDTASGALLFVGRVGDPSS